MENTTLLMVFLVVLIALLGAGLILWGYSNRNRNLSTVTVPLAQQPQVLQAHERMLLLVDRIALPHLLQRLSLDGLNALDLQFILVKTIREEYDYNVTQQLYMAPPTWKAIQSLKEQNLQWIRTTAARMPNQASAIDFQKALLQVYFSTGDTPLHELVAAAISHDAQQLLKA